MKLRRVQSQGDDLLIEADLTDPNIDLDLTSDPWLLASGMCPVVLGRDVVHAGRIAPDGGRRSCGFSSPAGAICDAQEAVLHGWTSKRYSDVFYLKDVLYESADYAGTTTTLQRLTDLPYAWPQEMIGATIIRNDDGRAGSRETAIITGISTTTQDDDTITFFPPMTAWTGDDKFSIVYRIKEDQRGVWMTDGRTIWLLQCGTFTRMLIMPSYLAIGEKWNICVISSSLALLTNPKYPPRILHLADGEYTCADGTIAFIGSGSVSGTVLTDTGIGWTANQWRDGYVVLIGAHAYGIASNTTETITLHESAGTANPVAYVILQINAGNLAGMLAPKKPDSVERSDIDQTDYANPSWYMVAGGAGTGALSAGNYRVKIRAVNTLDGAESRFADALAYDAATQKWSHYATVPATGSINVYETDNLSGHWDPGVNVQPSSPPLHERWTHLEIWRTEAGGEDFYLERRIEIVSRPQEGTGGAIDDRLVSSTTSQVPCVLSDSALIGQTPMSDTDQIAGLPPPICQQAVSIQGVTICAGAAHEDAEDPTVYARGFHFNAGSYNSGTHRLTKTGLFEFYTFRDGDQVVIEGPTGQGIYDISSRVDLSNIVLSTYPASTMSNLIGYLRRPHTIEWPRIESDEDLWYSRTDKSAPESFLSRTLRLSDIGDTFKRMVHVLNYAAIVMLKGVHLAYLDSTGALAKDTISSDGEGTPWGDSVVAFDRYVVWATPRGPVSMTVSEEASYEGHRAQIAPLDIDGRLRQWFEDAYIAGDNIDAGVDAHNGAIRFRRTLDDNTFQVLQYSYRTKRWTMLDDDSGLRYVRSSMAESAEKDDLICYSVTKEGNLFEVNHYGLTDPYAGCIVQAVMTAEGGYTKSTTSITKTGAFSAVMAGDVVRFRSATAARDGVCRVIRTATANSITFDSVSGLNYNDEFIIGTNRFRIRFEPYLGADREAVKRIKEVTVSALPGPRHDAGAMWSAATPGKISVRSVVNHADNPADSENAPNEGVSILSHETAGRISKDHVSSVEGIGHALALEIECIEARTDFRIEMVRMQVSDSSQRLEDASETE